MYLATALYNFIKILQNINIIILPVTSILVFTITGDMATAIAFITVGFAIAAHAATTAAAASSATTTECSTVHGTILTAVPGKMAGPVAPVTHNSSTHD